jgi:hypothetical protein
LDDIRALSATIERDRELLMSLVPSDTLRGWVDWIVDQDLPRFVLEYYGVAPPAHESDLENRIVSDSSRACAARSYARKPIITIAFALGSIKFGS